jgi:hypothetical protein
MIREDVTLIYSSAEICSHDLNSDPKCVGIAANAG